MANKKFQSSDAHELMSELGIIHVYRYLDDRRKQKIQQFREGPLSLWWKDAASAQTLLSYVRRVTNKNSPDYIPPQDRIAVSDLDGTLFCETDPTYFDFRLYHYRILEDPDYKDQATDYQISVAKTIEELAATGKMPPDFEVEIGNAIADTFAGMTVEQFTDYVRKFGNLPAHGYDGMKAGEAFYKPMIQALELLRENDFTIFICSGTDREVVRSLVSTELAIPPRNVLATGETIVARNQGDTDGTKYLYTGNDELVLGGKIQGKNLKMNKVSQIAQEIGQQPVLCFGNSSGDYSMANYVTDNNKYSTLVMMLCCDDLERENGKQKKAAEMEEMCKKSGWTHISMKKDWKTIYGEGVTKKTL